jgi:phosphatidate cytidylyltransferase
MQDGIEDMEGLTVRIRILSALLGIPILVFVLVIGGKVLTVALTIVSFIALKEFYGLFKRVDVFPFQAVGLVSGAVINVAIGFYGGTALAHVMGVMIACTLACFAIMIVQSRARILDLGVTLVGIVYVSLLMSMILMVYSLEEGNIIVWLIFVVAWLGDTLAYFIGINFGRHRLCPDISPKKSVEGAVGGLLGSVLGSVAFGIVVAELYGLGLGMLRLVCVGFIGGVMAQLGDLTASIIKRYAGVKDFGNLMPGHGGVLDRFDSILFTVPVVYYILVISG